MAHDVHVGRGESGSDDGEVGRREQEDRREQEEELIESGGWRRK